MRVLLCLVLFCLTPAWAISFTVQLFASSDETKASQIQSELASQGYPAYLLSVPTAQGQVYRIRVGAFANRAAAALFAKSLPSIEGSTPSPALAEGGVPPGFIPLEPALLGQYDLSTTLVQVIPWPVIESEAPSTTPEEASSPESEPDTTEETTSEEDSSNTTPDSTETNTTSNDTSSEDTSETAQTTTDEPSTNAQTEEAEQSVNQRLEAIRVQPRDASEQAHYRIGALEFDAWKAVPAEDSWIVRVRSLSVWPEEWETVSEAERNQYRETVLANIAGDLDLTPRQLEPFVFELENKAPFVVLVERFNPETQELERFRAIGQPRPNEDNLGLSSDGPASFFGESVDIPSPDASTIVEPSSSSETPDELLGNGWSASGDDEYVNLTVNGKTWRAANGKPVWANGDLLISIYEGQGLLYQFREP